MKKYFKLLLVLFLSLSSVSADEGMWLPHLLQQLNAPEMRIKGLQIPVEEIYNTDKPSLKDAVVLFGGGCTGEMISGSGLLLTNHHCGYGQIQDHSTLEKNYLRDGFWAMELKDEIPCPGLTATFVVKIIDVTQQFRESLTADMTEAQRNEKIKTLSAELEKKEKDASGYDARVRQFYSGNEFYMILTETFKDVRMVGAPPSSVGKFGGDTDNWMWPRHTGDFSLFRIYANAENKPAEYSQDNKPYTPRKFFSISLAGVQEGDFTMVYGFPGRTQQYISSYAVDALLNSFNPNRISIRTEKLRIIDAAMLQSEELKLKYASKQSSISNAWKKWKGEKKGLENANALQRKRDLESDFQAWTEKDVTRKKTYGNVLKDFADIYGSSRAFMDANDFYAEAIFGVDLIGYANAYSTLINLSADTSVSKTQSEAEKLKSGLSEYFREYDIATDKLLMKSMLQMFDAHVPDSLKPAYYIELREKHRRNYDAMTEAVFKSTIFTNQEKLTGLLTGFNSKKVKTINNDPAFKLATAFSQTYRSKVVSRMTAINEQIQKLNRLYMAGQREMMTDKKFYPDANSTLRIAYGQVMPYEPADGVKYHYITTLDGIMEKAVPGDPEFDVPVRLTELYNKKDYGRYAVNGTVPVSFIATNHTTGGNSGSPVLNAKGQLIGTNYDRVWEGTMSDVLFNPEVCRNITLDIRFTLFIIEKYAGANRLIAEMDIIP